MSLTLTREGKAVARVPYGVTEKQIQTFISRHAGWLQSKLSERGETPDFTDGTQVTLCGSLYTVATGPRARIARGILYLPAEKREEALMSLLRRLTRVRMKEFLDTICAQYGLAYEKLTVTSARGRWGSCSGKKHIAFTFRTTFLPDELCEYLAAHELCHTLHMDHSAAFWREVARIVPDHAQKRKALKGYLWVMNCL